jgi:hypothetical protein
MGLEQGGRRCDGVFVWIGRGLVEYGGKARLTRLSDHSGRNPGRDQALIGHKKGPLAPQLGQAGGQLADGAIIENGGIDDRDDRHWDAHKVKAAICPNFKAIEKPKDSR